MRQKLFKKQIGTIALIVLLTLSSVLVILTFVFNNYFAKEKYNSLQRSCETVSDFVEYIAQDNEQNYDKFSLYYIMQNLSNVSDFDIFITDKNGVITICSCDSWSADGKCEHTGMQIDINTISSMMSGDGRTISKLGIYSNPHYAYAVKLKYGDETDVGYVVTTDSISEVTDFIKKVAQIYVISVIIPLLFIFIAMSVMTYRLTKPLKLMSEAAKAMAKGDFSRRIPVTRDDEIGQLAVSFNQMTNSLARLEDVRKSFIANVSHELKTPMTTIGGFIDGIMDGTIPPDKQNYYLQIVHDEVKRLSRMVESMLSVSRLESNEFVLNSEPFNFKEQVLSIVIAQEQRIDKKHLNIEGLDTLPDITVNADKDLIHRVVYNLVDNAVKFSNDGGSIKFASKYDSKNVTFRIENTGRGIPQSELPYVFERFYKVDKSRSTNKESTGLGLYIVKTIIKNHGGTISVSSVENQFTAFEFTLPINR